MCATAKARSCAAAWTNPRCARIAQATHGAYYPLGPLGEGLAKTQLALESLSVTGGSGPARKFGVDRFHLPVAAVLGLAGGGVPDRNPAPARDLSSSYDTTPRRHLAA